MAQYDYPMRRPQMVIERSPLEGLFDELPGTLLNIFSLGKQFELQLAQTQLNQEFTQTQGELAFARQMFTSAREREALLTDQVAALGGLSQEFVRKDTADIVKMNTTDIYKEIDKYGARTDYLSGIQSTIAAAASFAEGEEDIWGGLIKAGKDEAWKDYMLEGGLKMGPEGEVVGTMIKDPITGEDKPSEMALWLEQQDPETLEKLKDANYRTSLLKSLRSVEEAHALAASNQAIATGELQQEAARTAINANNFQLFQAKHEEFETNMAETFKHQALNFTAQFRYGGYSMMDLVALGAEDPKELIKIKEEFAELYPNIAHDANKFLSGIQNAQANGVDPSRFVVKFYAKAYEDFLELDEFKTRLAEEGKELDVSYKEMYSNLSTKDASKIEIDRLTAKVEGFKSLGMFDVGADALNHMYAVTKMHDEQQSMRLTADVAEHERVSGYGLQLDPIETYYPEQYEFMEPEERVALEKSLAFISATGDDPPPPPPPGDRENLDAQISASEKLTNRLSSLREAGFQGTEAYENISDSLYTLNQEILEKEKYEKYILEMQEKLAKGQMSDEELTELSSLTGVSKFELIDYLKQGHQRKVMDLLSRIPVKDAPPIRPAYERRLQK